MFSLQLRSLSRVVFESGEFILFLICSGNANGFHYGELLGVKSFQWHCQHEFLKQEESIDFNEIDIR